MTTTQIKSLFSLKNNNNAEYYSVEAISIENNDEIIYSESKTIITEISFCAEYDLFKNLKITHMANDSMSPTFEKNDLLFIDTAVNEFIGDGLYIFTKGLGLYIKKLHKVGDHLEVLCDNTAYKSWELRDDDNEVFIVHGKVMFSQSMRLKKFG